MFKYLIAKCPLSGGEHTASDWFEVVTRHKDLDCAEDGLIHITKAQKVTHKYQVFNLKDYQVGEQFNIKSIHNRHKG